MFSPIFNLFVYRFHGNIDSLKHTLNFIGHVRYISILTWIRGFQGKLLYLMLSFLSKSRLGTERQTIFGVISFYPSLFWELKDKKNVEILQFSQIRILIDRTWLITGVIFRSIWLFKAD